MHPAARKCSRCEEGYRHPVGNCVLCGSGPAPGGFDEIPSKRDRQARFMALGRLNMQLLSNESASAQVCGTGPLLDYGLKPGPIQCTSYTVKFNYNVRPDLKCVTSK